MLALARLAPLPALLRGSRVPASLLLTTLLGTTACPGDDSSVMTTTGEDSTTTGDTTMSSVSVTVTVTATDSTTEAPGTDSTTAGVDSTDGTTTTGETTDATTSGGPTCGDDMAQGDEQCDGTDLAEQDCVSQGFSGGRLACAEDCTFDTSGCTNDPVCGNDVIDGKDVCDGADLGGADCTTEGFDGGTLGCLPDCTGYDTSACTSATCEDEDIGMAVGPAVSMGDTTAADDDFEPSCGGTGGPDHVVLFTAPSDGVWIFDSIDSDFDTKMALFTDCDNATEVACNDDANGFLQSEVQTFLSAGQSIYVVIEGYNGATGNYVLNINPSPCGNGVANPGEFCDGADLPAATCDDAGLGGAGAVTCAADCSGLDASACNPPTGYGNCTSFVASTVCTAEEQCVGDGTGNTVCLEESCANVGECGPAPATGNAVVTCDDVFGGPTGDCYLSCALGETCPDGMFCALDFICLWPPLP